MGCLWFVISSRLGHMNLLDTLACLGRKYTTRTKTLYLETEGLPPGLLSLLADARVSSVILTGRLCYDPPSLPGSFTVVVYSRWGRFIVTFFVFRCDF